MTLDQIAEAYVKLVLSVGMHDDCYVDAYYGPPDWQDQTIKHALSDLLAHTDQLLLQFKTLPVPPEDERLRQDFLFIQLGSVHTYLNQLAGKTLAFDAESLALYDAQSPSLTEADFDRILLELGQLLPGDGDLNARLSDYQRESFPSPVA